MKRAVHYGLRTSLLAVAFACVMPAALRAEPAAAVHPDVQRALDYQLPAETCVKPEIRNSKSNAFKVEKAERGFRRYVVCLEDYQKGLFNDFTFMQTAVSHGVTMAQAAVIKGHLEQIAATIKSVRDRGAQLQQGQARPPGGARASGSAPAPPAPSPVATAPTTDASSASGQSNAVSPAAAPTREQH